MRFELLPGVGVGFARLGMTRDEARAAMQAPVSSFRKAAGTEPVDAFFGNAFQVFYGSDQRVEFIELSRGAGLEASLDGVDLFQVPVDALIARLEADHGPAPLSSEPGYSFAFPSLGLSLWRSGKPEADNDDTGRCFDAVGIGVPGSYGGVSG